MSSVVRRVFAWHPLLMTTAGLMVISTVVSLLGLALDPQMILGQPAWSKPLKFSLSILLYSVTWAWLIAQLPRWQKLAHWCGNVIAVTLIIEQVLIVWAVATGTTSHFNVSDGVHAAVWAIMAVSITILYMCTFITTIALVFLRLPAASVTFAVRAGSVIALGGLGVAFLMTGPTAAQLANYAGIIGAHSVGVADGGPGIPVLGWSSVAGDYRVAHFVGIHALQILPLAAVALAAAGRRVSWLQSAQTQLRLMVVAAGAYAAVTVLVAVQASIGQSVAHPDGLIAIAGWGIAVASVVACGAIVLFAPAPRRAATTLGALKAREQQDAAEADHHAAAGG